jgi:hypothetical protein
MRNADITSANHTHGKTPVASLCFVEDYSLVAKVKATREVAWSQSRGFCSDAKDFFNIAFAIHHLEHRMGLMVIQEFLGHKSNKTMGTYTHIARTALAKIKSPLDHFIGSKANNINKIQK